MGKLYKGIKKIDELYMGPSWSEHDAVCFRAMVRANWALKNLTLVSAFTVIFHDDNARHIRS